MGLEVCNAAQALLLKLILLLIINNNMAYKLIHSDLNIFDLVHKSVFIDFIKKYYVFNYMVNN